MAGFLLAALVAVLGAAVPAHADGAMSGADVTVAQSLGDRELTVVLRRVASLPGPLHVDVLAHAGSPAGTLRLGALPSAAGAPSSASLTLPGTPGPVPAVLRVDSAGPWELTIDDGQRLARIPFVVHAQSMSPAERWVYGGFVAAGLSLAAALVVALAARSGWWTALPGAGVVAGVAVAVTAALLSASQPLPPAPGEDLDATVVNAADPYAGMPRGAAFSRPPVTLTVQRQPVVAGAPATVRLRVTDAATGLPADDLVVHDGGLMHLMVVSPSDRLWHLHPIRTAPGSYEVTFTPDAAGTYAVTAEVARRGGGVQMLRAAGGFTATGRTQDRKAEPLTVRSTGTIDGVGVQVAMADPVAGTPVTLRARIGDEADLQPWLGMLGHLIVAGPTPEGDPVWLHAHAMDDATAMHDMEGMDGMAAMVPMPGVLGATLPDETVAAYGPAVGFTVTFPLPGRYRIWLQAEKDYRIITVPITADVRPAPEAAPGLPQIGRVTPERARTGTRDVTVTLTGRDGRPATAPQIQVQAVLPTMGHASPVITGIPRGRGRYAVPGVPLMAAGGWQLRVTAPGSEPLTIPLTVTD
ncbi:hypothetical protein Asp14428_29370 [Actinoplanes sp. NBRC 14428]|uniref:YtkA-like protein n=2 Tax=Pseudosporangium ferrugineum TaxID=439699 RepID=A0A2T0RRS3_9ACTN|nr:hypothetical protein CLV70_11429 [Pseudosporangium ferrugineum]BCJ51462.1 hypothetical protein Asp14428_29370 [Actinoplanes sp. NBRC 14428]